MSDDDLDGLAEEFERLRQAKRDYEHEMFERQMEEMKNMVFNSAESFASMNRSMARTAEQMQKAMSDDVIRAHLGLPVVASATIECDAMGVPRYKGVGEIVPPRTHQEWLDTELATVRRRAHV